MAGPSEVFSFDASTYVETQSARIPEGDYLVKVEDAEATVTKGGANPGSPMLVLTLSVVGGQYAGSTIIDRLVWSEKSKWRVKQAYLGLGLPWSKAQIKTPIKAIVGRTAQVSVKDGKPWGDNQVIKSEISGWSRPSAALFAVPDDAPEEVGEVTPEELAPTTIASAAPLQKGETEYNKNGPLGTVQFVPDDDEDDQTFRAGEGFEL